jgi:hypothetical protein
MFRHRWVASRFPIYRSLMLTDGHYRTNFQKPTGELYTAFRQSFPEVRTPIVFTPGYCFANSPSDQPRYVSSLSPVECSDSRTVMLPDNTLERRPWLKSTESEANDIKISVIHTSSLEPPTTRRNLQRHYPTRTPSLQLYFQTNPQHTLRLRQEGRMYSIVTKILTQLPLE